MASPRCLAGASFPQRLHSYLCVRAAAMRTRARRSYANLLVICLLPFAEAGTDSVVNAVVDYCVSSRWGYSCFRPSSGALIDLSGGRLGAAIVRALRARSARPHRTTMHATNGLHARSTIDRPCLSRLAGPQTTLGRTSARGALLVGGAVLVCEVMRDVRGLRREEIALSAFGRAGPPASVSGGTESPDDRLEGVRRRQDSAGTSTSPKS
jgi:hypothetical protein